MAVWFGTACSGGGGFFLGASCCTDGSGAGCGFAPGCRFAQEPDSDSNSNPFSLSFSNPAFATADAGKCVESEPASLGARRPALGSSGEFGRSPSPANRDRLFPGLSPHASRSHCLSKLGATGVYSGEGAAQFESVSAVGGDAYTGYFEPVYEASRTPTAEFRYPLYRLPPNLADWDNPTRLELEGADGLQGGKGRLRGLELAWLRDRLQAYLIQVQGSARLELGDGSTMSVGYAGRTEYPYVSIGRELVNAGKFRLEEVTLPLLIDYFRQYPSEMDTYLPRNN
nr:MltA domain-containing protein [Oculatellaceae cyanobacterium Prado106]